MRPFLTASWRHLALLTYDLDRGTLEPFLPTGCTLDEHPRWPGRGLASLVAFDFEECAVWGVRWRVPGMRLVNFPEVNLRFYVRGPRGRGVCFVAELVPSRVVSVAARALYNEPYRAARMESRVVHGGGTVRVDHTWHRHGKHGLSVEAEDRPATPQPDSVEHFFKEHEWGYGRDRGGRTLAYRVEHPVWRVFTVRAVRASVGFAALYGEGFGGLEGREPISTVLAEGSTVAVYPPERAP